MMRQCKERSRLAVALAAVALAVALAAPAARAGGPEDGDAAPPLTPQDASKWVNATQPLVLESFKGKVVALLFFGTTAPDMAGYAKDYVSLAQAKKDDGLVVIGVTRENRDIVNNWCDENKITFPIVSDLKAWKEAYEISGYPYVFVIGVYGEVAFRGDGNELKALKPEVDKALSEAKRIHTKKEDTSKAFDKVWRCLDKNDTAGAIKFLQPMTESQDDSDKLHATSILADLTQMADARLRRAAELEKKFDFLQGEALLKQVDKGFAGLPESKTARDELTRYGKDETIQRELKAQKLFEGARQLEERKEYQKAGDVFNAVAHMLGTHVAPKAQMHINDLVRRHVYRPS